MLLFISFNITGPSLTPKCDVNSTSNPSLNTEAVQQTTRPLMPVNRQLALLGLMWPLCC